MRLDIPFRTNTANDCGPVALQMVLAHFGEEHSYEELSRRALSYETGATMTLGLAKAAAELGFPVELFSAHLGFNPAHLEEEFYQEHAGAALESRIDELKRACAALHVRLIEREMTREEIFAKTGDGCIPIILFDWNTIRGRSGYHGHFMVLVGHDATHVFLHQPGPKDPTPQFMLTHEEFDAARKTKGTDEDILFIRRKVTDA